MPTLIEYIGKRPNYTDSLYGTGDWTKNEVKPVHDVTATRMLKHVDQYQRPKAAEPKPAESVEITDQTTDTSGQEGNDPGSQAETGTDATATSEATAESTINLNADVVGEPKPAESEEEKESQEARDSVAHMDKDALLNYAEVHFRQSLDKRMNVENIRQRVVTLIDQYGLK